MALLVRDIGPTPANFTPQPPFFREGSGRILCLAMAADGRRLSAGGYAGVWRGDDPAPSFRQMSRSQPARFDAEAPGAPHAPHLFDIAVSPGNPDIVLAAAVHSQFKTGRDGVWRS